MANDRDQEIRFRFKDLAKEFVPVSESGRRTRLDSSGAVDLAFMQSVVDRWREATTTGARPKGGVELLEQAAEFNAPR